MYGYGEFKVILKEVGKDRIAVIRVLREATALTVSEAAELLERAPVTVKEGLTEEDADSIRKRFAEAGATAQVEKERIAGVDYV